MTKQICIISDKHISANPRVWKEAMTLSANGYSVTIVTQSNSAKHRVWDESLIRRIGSQVKIVSSVSFINGEIHPASALFYKARLYAALILKKIGIDTLYLLNRAPERLYRAAIEQQADLYIAHVECGMYVGKKLIEKGKRVAFDFEDWYSKDYLVKTRPVALLSRLENFALRNGLYVSCPSRAMAEALKNYYNVSTVPQVIYNGFPVESIQTTSRNKETVVVWFSQVVGAGRGLEQMIDCLGKLNTPVKLLLVGMVSDGYRKSLESSFPFSLGHKIEFIPFVEHDELHNLLMNCDIGLALEQHYPESRNKTVTNKILQYLQAGLKVLATDTDGQKEIASVCPAAIRLIDANDSKDWAGNLGELIRDDVDRMEIIKMHDNTFSWNAQERKFLTLVEDALV